MGGFGCFTIYLIPPFFLLSPPPHPIIQDNAETTLKQHPSGTKPKHPHHVGTCKESPALGKENWGGGCWHKAEPGAVMLNWAQCDPQLLVVVVVAAVGISLCYF